jgi:hypothetical protein
MYGIGYGIDPPEFSSPKTANRKLNNDSSS